MTCAELQELVWLAIDDEIVGDERRQLDEHLAGCAECRRKVESSRRVARGLSEMAPPGAPAGFSQRTLARLDAPPVLRVASKWRPVLSMAAALLLVATFWVVLEMRRSLKAPARSEEQVASNAPIRGKADDAKFRDGERKGELDDQGRPVSDAPPAPGAPPPAERAKYAEGVEHGFDSGDDEASGRKDGGEAQKPEKRAAGDKESRESDLDAATGASKEDAEKAREDEKALEEKRPNEANADASRDSFDETPIDELVRDAATPAAALEQLTARARAAAEWKQTEESAARLEQAQPTSSPPPPADERRRQELEDENRKVREDAKLEEFGAQKSQAPLLVVFVTAARDDAATQEWLRAHPGAATDGAIVVVDAPQAELETLRGSLAKKNRATESMTAKAWLERAAALVPAAAEKVAKLKAPETPATTGRAPTGAGGPETKGGAVGGTTGTTGTAGKGGKAVGAPKRGAAPAADRVAAATPVRIVLLLEPEKKPTTGQR